ncbi:MAG: PEP-CTERM sorting domain-containing protein [Phycisphaerae bacterium]
MMFQWGPTDLAFGPDGTLYVADWSYGGLYAVDQEGNATLLVSRVGAYSIAVFVPEPATLVLLVAGLRLVCRKRGPRPG